MSAADFWNDQKKAQALIRNNNTLKALVDSHDRLTASMNDLSESVAELNQSFDEDLAALVEEEYRSVMKDFDAFEIQVLLSGPYDNHNCILEIHPGAGGTEAMDWAGMLYRMYVRWAERHGFKVNVLDYQDGEEAGMKSCSLQIEGPMAYGYLKAFTGLSASLRLTPTPAVIPVLRVSKSCRNLRMTLTLKSMTRTWKWSPCVPPGPAASI